MPAPTTLTPVDMALLSLDHPTLPRLASPLSDSLAWTLRGAVRHWSALSDQMRAHFSSEEEKGLQGMTRTPTLHVLSASSREGSGGQWGGVFALNLRRLGVFVSVSWSEAAVGCHMPGVGSLLCNTGASALGTVPSYLYLDDGTAYTRALARAVDLQKEAKKLKRRARKRGKPLDMEEEKRIVGEASRLVAWGKDGLHKLHSTWGRTLELFYIQSRQVGLGRP